MSAPAWWFEDGVTDPALYTDIARLFLNVSLTDIQRMEDGELNALIGMIRDVQRDPFDPKWWRRQVDPFRLPWTSVIGATA